MATKANYISLNSGVHFVYLVDRFLGIGVVIDPVEDEQEQ